jgi:C4-dicarboxylate transporter
MNVTVPVGVVPPAGGVTVAVNVTLVPTVTFVALAVSAVALVADTTVTEFAPVALVYVSAPDTSGV